MKKLFLLISTLISISVFGQFPNSFGISNSQTQYYVKGGMGADSSFIFRTAYADTTAANRGWQDAIPGCVIRTIGGYMWVRNDAATAWILISQGTGGGTPVDTTTWRVSGTGQTIVNSISGGGIGTANIVPLWLITSGAIRIQIPAGGITRQTAARYKTMLYDTIDHNLGYGDAGAGSTPGIDDVLAVGQSFTTNRTVNGAGFDFKLYSAAGNILFNTKANSTSYGSRLYLNGDSAWYIGNNKANIKTNGVGNIMHLNPGQNSSDIVTYNKILAVKESDGEAALLPWPSLNKNLNPSDWLVTPTKRAQSNWPEFYTSGVSGDSTGSYYETSMYTPSPVKMNNGNLYVWTKGDLNKVIYGWKSINNGITWDTIGQTLSKGGAGTFDEFSVAMPAAYHIAATDSVYLYYSGIPVYPYENGGLGLSVAAGSAPNTMTKKKQALSIPDFITQMGISHNLIYISLGSIVKYGTEYYFYGGYWKAGFGMADSTIRLWEGHSNSLDTIKNCREILAPTAQYTMYDMPTVYHGADSLWYMIFTKGFTDENGGIDSSSYLVSAVSNSITSSNFTELPGRLYEHDADSTWKGKRVYNAKLLKDEYGNPILSTRDSVYGYPDDGTEPFYMLFYSGSYLNSYHDQSSYLKIMPQTDSLTFGTGYNGSIPNITRRGTTILLNTPVADSLRDGQIKHEDWIKFNNKAPASGSGNYVWNQAANAQTGNLWLDNIVSGGAIAVGKPGSSIIHYGYIIGDPTAGIKFYSDRLNVESKAGLSYPFIQIDTRNSSSTTTPIIFAAPHVTGYSTPITQNNYSIFNVGDGVYYYTIPQPFNTTSSALTNYSTRIINYGHRVSGSNALTNVALYLEADSAQNNNALIVGNGNVGIGNASPSYKLDVTGKGRFTDTLFADSKLKIGSIPSGAVTDSVLTDASGNVKHRKVSDLISPYVTTGTYTPTLSNTTNVSASTAYQCQYSVAADASGNQVVTVSGEVDIDPTTTVTLTVLRVTLPITSNVGQTYEIGGTANDELGTPARISGNVANDVAEIRFTPVDVTNRTFSFVFVYKVNIP